MYTDPTASNLPFAGTSTIMALSSTHSRMYLSEPLPGLSETEGARGVSLCLRLITVLPADLHRADLYAAISNDLPVND